MCEVLEQQNIWLTVEQPNIFLFQQKKREIQPCSQ